MEYCGVVATALNTDIKVSELELNLWYNYVDFRINNVGEKYESSYPRRLQVKK